MLPTSFNLRHIVELREQLDQQIVANAALAGENSELFCKLAAAQKDAGRLDFATTNPVGKVHHENGRVFATLDWTRTTDPECLPDGTKLYAVLPSLDAVREGEIRMSKCQEELDKWFNTHAYGSQKLAARIWQAAWNARGKVDAEICHQSKEFELAEAIEQENENV